MIFRLLSAQWLAMGFVGVVSLGISIAVARILGPDQFGVYAIALSASAIITILLDGGFSNLLQREQARATMSLAEIGPRLLGMAHGHTLLMSLLFCIATVLLPSRYGLTLLSVILFSSVVVLNQFGLAILRGDGRLVRDASWQAGGRTFTAVAVASALFIGAYLPWHIFCAQFIGVLAFGVFVTRNLRVLPSFFVPLKVYLTVSPFVWLNFATVLYFRADLVLFEFLSLPKAAAGQYGVAYRLIEAVILFSSPIGLMLFRRFRRSDIDPTKILYEIVPAIIGAALGGVFFALTLWFSGNYLIEWGYGAAYEEAGELLMVLGCSLVFILPNGVLTQAALASGFEKLFAVSASIAAVINILGNLLLIPIYGVMAAAWMTVLTEAVLGACVATGMMYGCKLGLDSAKSL